MESPEDQEMLYKIQLLQAFDLPEWDDQKVTLTVEELYIEISKEPSLAIILDKVSKVEALQAIIEMTLLEAKRDKEQDAKTDKEQDAKTDKGLDQNMLYFSLLFQYEYFDLFHNCVLDFKHRGGVREKTLHNLLATF